MNFDALKAPFRPDEIEWRLMTTGKTKDGKWWGKCLAYITARAVMDRLDEVCGSDRWQTQFKEWGIGTPGALCGLGIKVGEEWVWKWDGADQPETEPMKGGLSGALKRAAVQWGIGRYLYDAGESWAEIDPDGSMKSEFKDKRTKEEEWLRWNPPALVLTGAPKQATPKPAGATPQSRSTGSSSGSAPARSPATAATSAHGDTPAKTFDIVLHDTGYKTVGEGTYTVKDQLKKLGFKWDKDAKAWTTQDAGAADQARRLPGFVLGSQRPEALGDEDFFDDEPPPGWDQ